MKKFITSAFISISFLGFSQSPKIDSLKQIIKLNKANFETYNTLAWEFAKKSQKDSLFYYNNMSEKFIQGDKERGMYHVLNSKYYMIIQNFDKSKEETSLSINFAKKVNDFNTLGSAYNTYTNIANYNGEITKAYEYSKKNLEYTIKSNNSSKILNSYVNLNSLALNLMKYEEAKSYYNKASKYFSKYNRQEQAVMKKNLGMALLKLQENEKSLKYLFESEKIFKQLDYIKPLSSIYSMLCESYTNLNSHEKAKLYGEKSLSSALNSIDSTNAFFALSKLYFEVKNYKLAKQNILKSIEIDKGLDNKLKLTEDYSILASINSKNGNIKESDSLLTKSLLNKQIDFDTDSKAKIYRDLIINHFKKEKNEEYLNYFEKYISNINVSLEKDKTKGLAELDEKYKTAEKEAKIKTQQLQLQKEKTNKYVAFGVILFLTFISIGGYIWFRNKQKQREKLLKLELDSLNGNINQMELQNLNQQLDPHEITNFIDSISGDVLKLDRKMHEQIINLWDITNIVLNHKEMTVDIESEITHLEKYFKVQQEIANPKFDYTIKNNLSNTEYKIPRLLLKNLANNAIKHGLNEIEGKIDVTLFEENNYINIHVEDNGKGFDTKNLNKGIGTSTYENIFTKLNLKNKEKATIEILNKDKGVLVKVCIPKSYKFNN